jgi:hypothetical protein
MRGLSEPLSTSRIGHVNLLEYYGVRYDVGEVGILGLV